jgi:hypothetical protein
VLVSAPSKYVAVSETQILALSDAAKTIVGPRIVKWTAVPGRHPDEWHGFCLAFLIQTTVQSASSTLAYVSNSHG